MISSHITPLTGLREFRRVLRATVYIVAASWLLSIAICTFGDYVNGDKSAPANNLIAEATAHIGGLDHFQPSGQEQIQETDGCCALSTLPSPTIIKLPLHALVYSVLPRAPILLAATAASAGHGRPGASTPGIPNHVLLANSLQPNAPPR